MSDTNTSALIIIIVAVILTIPVGAIWIWIARDRMKERRERQTGMAMRRNFNPMITHSSRRSSSASVLPAPTYSVDGMPSNPFVTNRFSQRYYTRLGSVARQQTQ